MYHAVVTDRGATGRGDGICTSKICGASSRPLFHQHQPNLPCESPSPNSNAADKYGAELSVDRRYDAYAGGSPYRRGLRPSPA